VLQVGFAMAQPFYDWIADAWSMGYQRKSGAIVSVDYKLSPLSERQFVDALITETTIPALDASSKEPAYLTVAFSPEYTRTAKPTATIGKGAADKQKAFLASSFRVEIDGLDCSKVSKVDAFRVRRTVSTDQIGEARDSQKEPGKLEFPNLKITLAEAAAKTWDAWFDDFVVKGNNAETNERSGTLVFLAPDRQKELGRITLYNLGIFALRRHPQVTNDDAIQRVTAELYCEQMKLQVGAPATTIKPDSRLSAPSGVRLRPDPTLDPIR
jgi:hypothetical protein